MKPIRDYINDPDLSTGGALVTLTGPPGCGKTNSLTQLAIDRFNEGHTVLWRGTAQAQWAALMANDIPVKLWVDDNISSLKAWVSTPNNGEKDVKIKEKVQEIEYFSDTDYLVKNADKKSVNVVIVPGLMGEKHETFYFRKTWIDILESLVNRRSVAQPYSFITDEGGDIWPCQQQLRKPFYRLVAERTPPLLAQLRKQLVFMYIAAHSTHDLHYFVWKIKGNTIGYMSNSNVKQNIHTEVDQSKVNNLGRGDVIVPPKDRGSWNLAFEVEDLEWVGAQSKFRTSWETDIPNLLEKTDDKEKDDDKLNPAQAAAKLADETSYTQSKAADIFGVTQSAVSQAKN